MDGVILTPLKRIAHEKGDIFHALKAGESGFVNFGEAYFSSVKKGAIKGWKKHTKMSLNLIVISGEIEFIIFNEKTSESLKIALSPDKNYQRLSIAPGLFVAFRGLGDKNILLNIASIKHDPDEAVSVDLAEFKEFL